MANNIEIDLETVTGIVSDVKSNLSLNQENIDGSYQELVNLFADSSGNTAEAIRSLNTAERTLAAELDKTLTQLADCIRFASEEFVRLDADMEHIMARKHTPFPSKLSHTGGRQ